VKDLRSFLDENTEAVVRLTRPVSVRHEATALQHALWRRGRYPVLLLETPLLADVTPSRFRALTNLTASRTLVARALGVADPRRAAVEIAERAGRRIGPVVVAGAAAPVKEVVLDGAQATLAGWPVFTQHEADCGPYLTAAHATTFDPDTGIDNTAIARVWAKPGHTMPVFLGPTSHTRANVLKFWERGEAAPIAFWIGHHPAVSIGAQAKLAYPESHWSSAGALVGEPLRLVATDRFGDRLRVPADAEIVLEGHVPPGRIEREGPFAEYTGYAGAPTESPVFVLERLTHRRDAIYHDCGSGLPDALVAEGLLIEAELLRLGRGVSAAVRNVHVPIEARRSLAVVQTTEVTPATARALLRALLAFRPIKGVVLVGEDVDIFDGGAVAWAIATRAQPDRDALVLSGVPGSLHDPSLRAGATLTSKLGLDATWTDGRRPPTNRVPEEIWRRLRLEDYGL
jgi:2,5-furandicarboxylate decarboxylase 1